MRRQRRSDLNLWCEHALAPMNQKPATHHRFINKHLMMLEAGKIDRLLVLAPPGSAKSTYTSHMFVAWYLARNPMHVVIAGSHTASLAARWGRRVRTTINEHQATLDLRLNPEKSASHEWELLSKEPGGQGGEYFAAGVGGPITGRRADLVVLDDLVKSRQEADSEVVRESTWQWYLNDLYTRLKPNGKIVLIMTHWHEDDIAGRLQHHMRDGSGDQWTVLRLPALAEPNDPLGRPEGAALWPEWEDEEKLQRKRRVVLERAWSALYQQRPSAAEGTIFKRAWWQKWKESWPKPEFVVISLDTAYTENEKNDRTACTVWYVAKNKDNFRERILLRNAWAEHLEFHELVEDVRATVKDVRSEVGARVPIRILIENKASGLSLAQEMRRRWPDLNIFQANPKGDKTARAYAVQEFFQSGSVWTRAERVVVKPAQYDENNNLVVDEILDWVFPPWAQMVIDECAAFSPSARFKDLVDSTTQALRHIRDMGIELFSEDEPPPPSATAGMPRKALY